MTTLTEEQKQDILINVKRNVGEWAGETLSLGIVPNYFEELHHIFKEANIDLNSLFNLDPLGLLRLTYNSAKVIGLSETEAIYAVDNWACDASKLLGLA